MNRPDTITIYIKVKDDYVKRTINDVYWYGSDSINISGRGIVESDSINIIIDKENVKNYVDNRYFNVNNEEEYTLQNGMRIVRGIGPDINSINELDDSYEQITIFSFDVNIVGSSLDNLYIRGK